MRLGEQLWLLERRKFAGVDLGEREGERRVARFGKKKRVLTKVKRMSFVFYEIL